jgi:ribosomal protein S12 methylthiotransferase
MSTFAFVSLGCPKNLVDSERMLGKLAQEGFTLIPDASQADVVVVNTCGFIEPARQESLGVLREMVELKTGGKVKAVIAAGCLAEREKDGLRDQVPGLDHMVGVFGREEIAQAVELSLERVGTRKGRKGLPAEELSGIFRPAPVKALEDTARLRATPRHYAYLKISEGCDRLCTFCAIPQMRGKHVSKPVEEILREARELADDGARELCLVAQDSTYYGIDLYGEARLAPLLRELDQLDGVDWIRLHYAYPAHVTDDLVNTLADSRRIVPYIDMPLQHINDRVLRRMNRKTTRAATEDILHRLRAGIPGLVLRSTFLVGFPGETEAEYEELVEWVREAKIERLGVFAYSHEPTTPSAKMEGAVPEDEKARRRDHLMAVQQEVAFAHARSRVGQTLPVMIDGPDPEMPGWHLGRTMADAPDIDPVARIKSKALESGTIIQAEITGSDGYDLMGKPARRR